PSEARRRGLGVFLLQRGFNFFWSILFVGLGRYGLALLWLLVMLGLIAAMIRLFSQVDIKAARLQIPYLLWVLFAAAGVFFLNS
ncbi:MAG: TspO/MBR family protein, partial [Dysosmobacter welbionis]